MAGAKYKQKMAANGRAEFPSKVTNKVTDCHTR
jgi:hypothetical protein